LVFSHGKRFEISSQDAQKKQRDESGKKIVSRSEPCGAKAEECQALAETARDPDVKRQYKDLAVHWLQLAEQAEKTKSVERKQSE
jgi:hypothetical protein